MATAPDAVSTNNAETGSVITAERTVAPPTSEPLPQNSWIYTDLPVGLVVGIALFGLASYFKESISKSVFLGFFCAGFIILATLYYLRVSRRHTAGGPPSLGSRLLRAPAFSCLALFTALVGIDLFGSVEEGLVRRMVEGKRVSEQDIIQSQRNFEWELQQRQAQDVLHAEAQKRQEQQRLRQQWNDVDFILVNAGQMVVGLRARDVRQQPEFILVAKAENNDSHLFGGPSPQELIDLPSTPKIIEHFWKRRMPIFSYDPHLTNRIFADVPEGAPLQGDARERVRSFWAPTRFVPQRPIIAYDDLRTNTRRFGFALDRSPNSLLFSELVPVRAWSRAVQDSSTEVFDGFAAERIDAESRIKPDSITENLLPADLRKDADLLDVFVMNMLQILQSRQSQATTLSEMRAPSLYVDEVSADLSVENQVRLMREELDRKNQEVASALLNLLRPHGAGAVNGWQLLDELRRSIMEKEKELSQANLGSDIRARLQEQVDFLRHHITTISALQEQRRSLGGEIRKRLSRAQVHMVDRSDKFKLLLNSKVSGKQWAADGVSVNDALSSGLIDASHVLLTE